MDFSGLISAVVVDSIVAALTAIAGLFMVVEVAKWGYNQVINWMDPDYGDEWSFHPTEEQIELYREQGFEVDPDYNPKDYH